MMSQRERLHTQIDEAKLKLRLLEMLPDGDLEPSICNVHLHPRSHVPHAWLNYYNHADLCIFEQLEGIGFKWLEATLIQWDKYEASPYFVKEREDRELRKQWPMCPLWVDLSGNAPTAIAFYEYCNQIYRVGVTMPRDLIQCEYSSKKFSGRLLPEGKWDMLGDNVVMHPETWISKRTPEADIYWECLTGDCPSPSTMYRKLL